MNTQALVGAYFEEVSRIAEGISRSDIERVIDELFSAWQRGGRVFIIGNGGSASTASHFASDLSKYTLVEGKERFKAMALVDNVSLVSAWTNDSGFGSIFEEQLKAWAGAGDVLVALSVHGGSGGGDAGPWSQNLVSAARYVKENQGRVVALSGFDGGAMSQIADASIVVPISTEPLATPLIESFHVLLHHLICVALREKIEGAE